MEHARLDDTSGVHLHTLQLSHNGDVGEERENDRSISLYCSANNEPASTTEAVHRRICRGRYSVALLRCIYRTAEHTCRATRDRVFATAHRCSGVFLVFLSQRSPWHAGHIKPLLRHPLVDDAEAVYQSTRAASLWSDVYV
ncbi:hypothetical protein LSAT2_006010 [Lamellibrachia satsuma]|nr:hypothetical protein LSAT2_006010 [Lamellibrachia satsuma]